MLTVQNCVKLWQLSTLLGFIKTHQIFKSFQVVKSLISVPVSSGNGNGDVDQHFNQWLAPLLDGQKFKCLMCAKEFTQKGNARSHFKQFHSGVQEPPAVCHVCGKRFNRGKRNRNEHLRVVHGITQAMMRQMNPALVNL